MRNPIVFGIAFIMSLPAWSEGRAQDPQKLAQMMIKALHDGHAGLALPPSPGREQTERAQFVAACIDRSLRVTGEVLTPNQKVLAAVEVGVWFASRQPMTPERSAMYLARLERIERPTVETWLAGESRVTGAAIPKNSAGLLMMTHIYIATQDYFFDGPVWRRGWPEKLLIRLASLSPDAFSRWSGLVKTGGDRLDSAWTVLTVDALFTDDTFQLGRFDAALPLAQKLLPSQ